MGVARGCRKRRVPRINEIHCVCIPLRRNFPLRVDRKGRAERQLVLPFPNEFPCECDDRPLLISIFQPPLCEITPSVLILSRVHWIRVPRYP